MYSFEISDYQKRIKEFEKDLYCYLPQDDDEGDREVRLFARQVHNYLQNEIQTDSTRSSNSRKNQNEDEDLIENKVQYRVNYFKNKLYSSVIQSYFLSFLVMLTLAITTEKVSWGTFSDVMIAIACFMVFSFFWITLEESAEKNQEVFYLHSHSF